MAETPSSQGEHLLSSGGLSFELRELKGGDRVLVVTALERDGRLLDGFDGLPLGEAALACRLSEENARELRRRVPWLQPKLAAAGASFGFGDRLGGATEGHLRALRGSGLDLVPIVAQQSVRELARSARTAEAALGDATWGLLAAGWTDGFGADADHIQRPEELEPFAAAGYTMYTLDPHASVDEHADAASGPELEAAFAALPWDTLADTPEELKRRFAEPIELETQAVTVDAEALTRAAVKYGKALVHVAELHRALVERLQPGAFEVEVSVDESDSPTSAAEHVYLARELKRLGVEVGSLAPRFPGAFEKGVDFVGDLEGLARSLDTHAQIARRFGNYRLSLHSGSDKFSVYPLFAEAARGHFHVKTSGTSYLEALRVVATVDPALFREIYTLALARYPDDRATYHVSAEVADVPGPGIADAELPSLLDDRSARQILHVTFGSVLGERSGEQTGLRSELLSVLAAHQEQYSETIERHFRTHLDLLAKGSAAGASEHAKERT